jgi:hypothetical protein
VPADAGGMTFRAVDRLLQTFLGLVLALVVAGVLFAFAFIGQDAARSGELLDGVGTMIGLALLVLVGVPGAVAAVALRRSVRQQPHAADWALAAGLLGVLTAGVLAFVHRPFAAALAPALLLTVAAAAPGGRPRRRAGPGDRFAG